MRNAARSKHDFYLLQATPNLYQQLFCPQWWWMGPGVQTPKSDIVSLEIETHVGSAQTIPSPHRPGLPGILEALEPHAAALRALRTGGCWCDGMRVWRTVGTVGNEGELGKLGIQQRMSLGRSECLYLDVSDVLSNLVRWIEIGQSKVAALAWVRIMKLAVCSLFWNGTKYSMELDHHAGESVVLSDLSVSVAFSWSTSCPETNGERATWWTTCHWCLSARVSFGLCSILNIVNHVSSSLFHLKSDHREPRQTDMTGLLGLLSNCVPSPAEDAIMIFRENIRPEWEERMRAVCWLLCLPILSKRHQTYPELMKLASRLCLRQDKMNTNGGHFQFQLKPTVGGGQVQHSILTWLLFRSIHGDFSCQRQIHFTNQSPKNPDFEGGRVLEQSGSRCAFCLQREQGCRGCLTCRHVLPSKTPKIPSKGPQILRYKSHQLEDWCHHWAGQYDHWNSTCEALRLDWILNAPRASPGTVARVSTEHHRISQAFATCQVDKLSGPRAAGLIRLEAWGCCAHLFTERYG